MENQLNEEQKKELKLKSMVQEGFDSLYDGTDLLKGLAELMHENWKTTLEIVFEKAKTSGKGEVYLDTKTAAALKATMGKPFDKIPTPIQAVHVETAKMILDYFYSIGAIKPKKIILPGMKTGITQGHI